MDRFKSIITKIDVEKFDNTMLESGAISAEHVINVLTRLNASPLPPSVETSLQLNEVPLSNTGRYDSLRDVEEEGVANAEEIDHA